MGHSTTLSVMNYSSDMADSQFISDLPQQMIKGIPDSMLINYVRWSPDGKHIAFTLRSAGGVGDPPRQPLELWVTSLDDLQVCQQ